MIWYMENPNDSTPKLLGFINEFGNVAGDKINTPKSMAFLYASNEFSETKQTIPYTVATKKLRYLGIINLTKR